MTETLDPKTITVGDRFRVDYGDLDALKTSIQQFGILQPIVIDRSGNLVAGGRRLRATLELGLEEIPTVYRDQCDELLSREIELEENIQRKDLTWQERAALVSEIDRIKRLRYGSHAPGVREDWAEARLATAPEANTNEGETPCIVQELGWDMQDTAASLQLSTATVSRDLAVARAIDLMPELADMPDRKSAMKVFYKRLDALERELAVRTGQLRDDALLLGRCEERIKELPDNSIDLLITDPPYGVDIAHGLRPNYTPHYDDAALSTLDQFKQLAPELRRVLKPNGHAYIFTGFTNIFAFMEILSENGFDVDPIPLIWVKNTEGLVDFDHRYALVWEPIIFCKSPRMLARKHRNVFTVDSDSPNERATLAQKPLALIGELIEMSSQEGEVVFDPFFGSGSTLVAAKQLGRKYVGIEQDKNMHNFATIKLDELDEGDEDDPTQETSE